MDTEMTGYAAPARVAKHLDLSKAQVYNLIKSGALRALRLPGTKKRATIRIAWESVVELERASAVK